MPRNAASTASGSGSVTIRIERKCIRNTTWASVTRRISSRSAVRSVPIERVDQLGTVVEGHDADAGRQARRDLRDPRLDGVDDLLRVHARSRDDDAADRLVGALDQRGDPKRVADLHVATCFTNTGTPAARRRRCSRCRRSTGSGRHRGRRSTSRWPRARCRRRCGCSRAPRDDRAQGHAVGPQPHRIDVDLVLLDRPADRGDLGDAGHGVELIADEPVLDRAQLAQRSSGPSTVYQNTWPTPVASGPSVGTTPAGSAKSAGSCRSSTRARAKYRSTSSSKTRRPSRSRTRIASGRRGCRPAPAGRSSTDR